MVHVCFSAHIHLRTYMQSIYHSTPVLCVHSYIIVFYKCNVRYHNVTAHACVTECQHVCIYVDVSIGMIFCFSGKSFGMGTDF